MAQSLIISIKITLTWIENKLFQRDFKANFYTSIVELKEINSFESNLKPLF